MKLKLLLFLMFCMGMLHAQEPYQQLIISEALFSDFDDTYVEITNMGDQTINLSDFKYGVLVSNVSTPVYDVWNDPFVPSQNYSWMMPDHELEPGESYVMTGAYDFGPRQYKKDPLSLGAVEFPNRADIYEVADLLLHFPEENGDETDSVSIEPYHYQPLRLWGGRDVLYVEHHFAEGDSAVVDQVGGVFDDDGTNDGPYDVAGVENATTRGPLIRKYKVKTGNLDFANARGVGTEDSEWIAIPFEGRGYNAIWNARDTWWTVGNHGAYVLDENTLESDVVEVDFEAKTLTVPWGVRRIDGIMHQFERKPGIAWHYDLNANYEDSLYRSAQTGDKLTIYVAGDELQTATFDIVVNAPTEDANIVIPIDHKSGDPDEAVTDRTQAGILSWPRVTQHEHGTDTITGSGFGLSFAMRTDTLLRYLEKPPKASWEFVWVDDVERPDLKNGDKLRVTAENSDVKEYFIQVKPPVPNNDAYLSSITWPDIPDFYRGVFGWIGDTIPGFGSAKTNYKVQVPLDVDGIPALVAKTADINATVNVKRATSLSGTVEDRTVEFHVTAEDDSVTNTYSVELVKQKDPEKVQPYYAEPFLAEFIYQEIWANGYGEIANPGNQPLDLSNYMITASGSTDPATHITGNMGTDQWSTRFRKYVPGYKWVSEDQWAVTPGILEHDLNVNPIVQPGDVFTMGTVASGIVTQSWVSGFIWPPLYELDVQFVSRDDELDNPWDEEVGRSDSPFGLGPNSTWMLFKILNDSVINGDKPANDPRDFELIEAFGMDDGSLWNVCGEGVSSMTAYIRKPDILEANPVLGASFGTDGSDCEWIIRDRAYWAEVGGPWKWSQPKANIANDIGQHNMVEATKYKSTVTSTIYKVDQGYKTEDELQIRGIITGTSVTEFLGNINKAHEDQALTFKATANGQKLTGDNLLNMNDTLIVVSADSTNMTKYMLEVSEDGLSSDALLSSNLYTIEVTSQPKSAGEESETGTGTISGLEYGTQLRTVVNNITVPDGASMSIVDAAGAYVPLQRLNFDTTYVDVTVNSGIYLDVTAEDGVTKIMYQIMPQSSESDAFVLSDVYVVSQRDNLIQFVPGGSNASTFLSYLVPAEGASMKLVDKMGIERTMGGLYRDDKVVVTSADGENQRIYYLAMLRTDTLENAYFAYVLSDYYEVDQIAYSIKVPDGNVMLSDFYSRITPAEAATAVVVDSDGEEQTSGDLDQGDQVKVTSGDGDVVVMYNINFETTARKLTENTIQLYPNPTGGEVNINGLESGTRVQVFNQTGAMIKDLKADQSLEIITLNNQPAGMYLFVITKDAQLVGHYKVIRK